MSGRLGDVQSYVLLLVACGANTFDKLVKMTSEALVPKSSVYTAVKQLAAKRLLRLSEAGRIELTEEGRRLLKEALMVLLRRLVVIRLMLDTLLQALTGEVVEAVLEGIELESLLDLKHELEQLMERIDRAISLWRRIEVEEG